MDAETSARLVALEFRIASLEAVAKPLPLFDEHKMLTPEECCKWLNISERELQENTRKGAIPCFQVNKRIKRYHPRTVMERLLKNWRDA